VKIQIEEVEERIKDSCPSTPFIITSRPDPVFGEIIVALLLKSTDEMGKKAIQDAISALPKYWRPKYIVHTEKLPMTETGKPDRAKAKAIAAKQ
jgi:O-succinylbenzoic acid--CoA ligase